MRQVLAVLSLLAFVPPLWAEQSGGLDWSAWQRMPVLQDGRIMPLDSFARVQVKKICGDAHPSLGKLGSKTNAEMAALAPEKKEHLAIEGRPRKFLAAELLYAWTVDAESWDDVPFLIADDETLRSEILDVPLRGEDGSLLRYVSPKQVRLSKKFVVIRDEIERIVDEAQQKKQKPKFSELQEKVKDKVRKLDEALGVFLQLSYDPGRPDTANPWLASEFIAGRVNPWLVRDFVGMQTSWGRFKQALSQRPALTVQAENLRLAEGNEQAMQLLKQKLQPCLRADALMRDLFPLAEKTDHAMQEFVNQWSSIQSGEKPVRSIEPVAANLRRLTSDLDATMHELAKTELPDPTVLIQDDTETIRSNRQNFSRWTKSFALQAAKIPWSLYTDGDEAVSVVPALEATALEADRYRSEIQPWISLNALLLGSPELLHGYPPEDVERIRTAWRDARTAYFSPGGPQRPQSFTQAMEQFTANVRSLAETIEPDRLQLPIQERDRGLLAKTAYPAAFATDAEVLYNQVDPFRWSGLASLAAACILGLSCLASLIRSEPVEHTYRNVTFWLGVSTLVAAVVLIAGGFIVRMYITRWAPVTSMFETIVWVGMCISLLTLWLTFLPLLGPASRAAWGFTAIPGTWEARRWENSRRRNSIEAESPEKPRTGFRAVALAMRVALFAVGVLVGLSYLGVLRPGDESSGYRSGSILPHADLGASMPSMSASLVWAASMFLATMFVWYLPRIVPAALLAIPLSIASAGSEGTAERMEKIYRWRVVAWFGAVVSFAAAMAALYAPFPKDIEPLTPVLRSNFWLGIHVLTITTSYACACAAWMMGNLALGYFAFGRYRTVRARRSSLLVVVPEKAAASRRKSMAGTALAMGGDAENEPLELEEVDTAEELGGVERRPPAFCGTLASLNYRVLQVTVLLLAAGTILGGLWADVSWGRFWGWDPKEVGALIALLVIMTALHGRRAGWHGDLSLAIGSVMGFGGVIWAWYVVNFILNAGLHSYGAGEGGQWFWLVAVAAIQLLYIAIAVARVMIETGQSVSPSAA